MEPEGQRRHCYLNRMAPSYFLYNVRRSGQARTSNVKVLPLRFVMHSQVRRRFRVVSGRSRTHMFQSKLVGVNVPLTLSTHRFSIRSGHMPLTDPAYCRRCMRWFWWCLLVYHYHAAKCAKARGRLARLRWAPTAAS